MIPYLTCICIGFLFPLACLLLQAERSIVMPFGTRSVKSINDISFHSWAPVIITNNKVYGQGPCNSYFGAVMLKQAGFEISTRGLSRMYCKERSAISEPNHHARRGSAFGKSQMMTRASRKDGMLIFERCGDIAMILE